MKSAAQSRDWASYVCHDSFSFLIKRLDDQVTAPHDQRKGDGPGNLGVRFFVLGFDLCDLEFGLVHGNAPFLLRMV
jgi:hypothetical protein